MVASGPKGIRSAGVPAFAKWSLVFTLRDTTHRDCRGLRLDAQYPPSGEVKVDDSTESSALSFFRSPCGRG